MKQNITFSFGRNWQDFLKSLSEDRFKNAKFSLTEFLGLDNLQGKSYLDIGCGSGLFSYAAFGLGADKVVSFDLDPFSIECCKYLREKADSPRNWELYQGSILDDNFISKLGKYDIVYAWGVLHHTGKMWEAIKNSAELVNNGGYYYIAIYNKVEGMMGSEFWLRIKKLYNSSPRIGKRALEALYMSAYFIVYLFSLRNPVTNIRNYKSHRGMSWRTDIIDWLGGYPYEFATVAEIVEFMKTNFPNFNCINTKKASGLANSWYLFQRNAG